ncbi:MAG: tRNA pseudouridine(55) synthase TruB [Gemmatimonadaceae bacterium]
MTTRAGRDGLLLIDKAPGVTSHDAVLAVRRATGEPRVGHTGTLDPFATGLLVVLLGRATRLLPYVGGDPKVYEATIRFGTETDTDDLTGAVVRSAPPPSADAVSAATSHLTGVIEQVPPAYSAKRVGGRRAYTAARAGEAVHLPPVPVRVDAWRLGRWTGADLDATVTCGGGTYIRALARDLGRLTGSAAHLAALRRVASGAFRVGDAMTMADLASRGVVLRPPLDALRAMTTAVIDANEIARIVRGIAIPGRGDAQTVALVARDGGALVALAVRVGDLWQPRVVMREVA